MTREIKFRAWIKEKKEMKKVEAVVLEDEFTHMVEGISAPYVEAGGWYDKFMFTEVELMQYTGLKDNNGVEIYEGDVVRLQWNEICRDTGIGLDCNYEIDKIIIVDDCFSIFELSEYGEVLEVIGNIYENPELLGDANE